MHALPVVSAALLSAALSAPAAAAPADRYQITPAEGGFLRLDRETGTTAFCAPSGEGYACRASTETERSATGDPAARIEKRLAAIEERLKALEGAAPGTALNRDPTLDLPTEQQIDRAASFFERAMKRLKQIAEDLQKSEPQSEPDRQRL